MSRIFLIYAILLACQAANLAEEVKTGFRAKFPLGEIPFPLFVGVNAALYLFCAVTLCFFITGDGRAIPFAWVFAVLTLGSGIFHVGMMARRKKYFPGGVTAFPVLLFSLSLVVELSGL